MRVRRLFAAVLAVTCVSFVAACGGEIVQQPDVETEMTVVLENQLSLEVLAVNCPADTPVEPEGEFECDAEITGGETVTVSAQVTNDEADIEITGVS